MKKIILFCFLLVSSYSFSLVGEHFKTTPSWELYSVLNEWGETTKIKVPYYETFHYKKSKREIREQDIKKFSYIIYRNENNELVMNIYREASIIEIDSRKDMIKNIKLRFDKKKVILAECLSSLELSSFDDETTGKVYYGNTSCVIKLTKEIIDFMKKSKEMEIIVPYFESTNLVNIKLNGFTKAIEHYSK